MATRKRKVYPQFVALELILVAALGAGAYYLAGYLGHGARFPVFLAGMVADRLLIIVLRHRNKPIRFQAPLTRRPAPRRPAGRRA